MDSECLVSKSIIKEWQNAILNSQNGYNNLVKEFKDKYPKEYKVITTMYRKRVGIKECLQVMEDMNEPIYWFTLTFNNSKDVNAIETKRKDAQRFLERMTICYLMVEEFGEDKGRYHVHGFLCFKYGYGFLDFKEWHSRQKIECLEEEWKKKKKTRYLTKYASKSIPRLRRSKTMSLLCNYQKSHKGMRRCFPLTYANMFKEYVANVANPF